MLNENMISLGSQRSVIREIAEYGWKRAAEIGSENVFDYSIGNPSVPPPDCVNQAIVSLVENTNSVDLHGYTSASGDPVCKMALAAGINSRFGTDETADALYLTCGAAASLCITLRAVLCGGDEVIVCAPYFPEYAVFIASQGGKCIILPPDTSSFQISLDALAKAVTDKTKAVILNSPNNPSGVVYSEQTISAVSRLLREKEKEYGHPIYIIADEPYRELAYDVGVPYIPSFYDDTLVCYSYSKSLSLPGERIGYVLVPKKAADCESLRYAVAGAGRSLGFVCAPSLFQRVIAKTADAVSDINVYKTNRDLLYDALISYGFKCVKGEGAFYLFPEAPDGNSAEFCERAKKHELLLVPGDGFGSPKNFRISYCVPTEKLKRSLAAFEALAKEYDL